MAETAKKTAAKTDDNVLAAVATIPVVGLIIYFAMPEASEFVKHYAKQSVVILALSIIESILWVVGTILTTVFIGVFILCIAGIVGLVVFALWVFLLINALQGKKYSIPVLSDMVDQVIK